MSGAAYKVDEHQISEESTSAHSRVYILAAAHLFLTKELAFMLDQIRCSSQKCGDRHCWYGM